MDGLQDSYCGICNKKYSSFKGSSPFSFCSSCTYRWDKYRAAGSLKKSIEHPSHPGHSLKLMAMPNTTRCNSCNTVRGPLRYHCVECNLFDVCLICYPTTPIVFIKYKSHPHFLRFVEDLDPDIHCHADDSICKSSTLPKVEFGFTQGYGFRCTRKCDFNIHLLCGPLPCTIKHDSHVDCLTLEDSIVEDDDPDDEYYCNTCEELRDPRVCVYYCAECKFVAHVHCVISEVVSSLKGEIGDGDLRVVGERMTVKDMLQNEEISENNANKGENKGPSVREIINSLDKDEEQELAKCFEPLQRKTSVLVGTSTEDQHGGSNAVQENAKDIEEDFKELMEKLEFGKVDSAKQWEFKEYEEECVNIEGYMLPWRLAPILKSLFAKYGDVSRESKLKHKVKSVLLSCLCWSINKMCKTLIVEISEDLLTLWWCNLKGIQHAGFKVEFIMDRLNKVTHAYFGIEARKRENAITAKLEAMSRELKVLEAKQQKFRTYNMRPQMKWSFAGEGLL